MFAALITAEVKTVLGDLRLLLTQGVDIAVVQATPEGGVSVGVDGDAGAAERALRDRYSFPVSCWRFE